RDNYPPKGFTMSKVNVGVENNQILVDVDTNEDGQSVVSAKLDLPEALQELMKSGDQPVVVEGKLELKFEEGKLKLSFDSNQDGEASAMVDLDLAEAVDESGILQSFGLK